MKYKFEIEGKQVLVAVFFFSVIIPLIGGAILGFSILDENMDDFWLKIFVEVWMLLIIPITFYIAVFTRFNNPFKINHNTTKEVGSN